jgi:hypothetical protein
VADILRLDVKTPIDRYRFQLLTIHANLRENTMMKSSQIFGKPVMVVAVFLQGMVAQSPQPTVQMPKVFQIYYEVGPAVASHADTFDSEKKTRTVAGAKGMTTYSAELTENEKSSIYAAIVQNDLLTIKDNFPKSPNWDIQPETAGRLRLTIDGKTKDIRFNLAYGCFGTSTTGNDSDDLVKYLSQLAQAHGMPPCVPDPEWPRFNNVRSLIDSILKRKDDEQHISHAMQF